MYFLIGVFIFTVGIIGLNFCMLLVGGIPFHKGKEFAPIKIGKRTYSVERFAVGVSTSVFGTSWLATWFYFLFTGWDSLIAQFDSIIVHVGLQLIASVSLIVSGVGIFRQWKRSKGIFITSMVMLFASVATSIFLYGPGGHGDPIFMYLLGTWTLVVGGFLTTVTYLLGRLLHDLDEQLPKNRLKESM